RRRAVRGDLLLPGRDRLAEHGDPAADAHDRGGVGGPHPGAERRPRGGAGVLLREPGRGDRGDAAPPARADLRLPDGHPTHGADAPPGGGAPAAHRAQPAARRARGRAGLRSADRRAVRALGGLRAGRCALAGRGARGPAPGRTGPGGHHRRRSHRLRRAVPEPAAPAGPFLRGHRRHPDAAAVHLRLAPGTGAYRPGRPAPAPAAVLDPARTGQAEVPGRLRVRDGRLDLRHQPGEDRRPAERGGGTVTTVPMLEPWDETEGVRRARALVAETLAGAPAGVWSAPGRVNLIGEHTDYNGGLCLPIALEHRTFVALRRRADDGVHLVSEREGSSWQAQLADVAPGAVSGWGAYPAGVAWALDQLGHPTGGFDAAVVSCVPYGAGLSSSA